MNNPSTPLDTSDSLAVHPIGVVARRTGLSVHVLRAWERRYDAVIPHRSEGGQRLYTDADIARVRLLRRATAAGHNISQLAALDDEALLALTRPEAPGPPETRPTDQPGGPGLEGRFVQPALEAAEALDTAGLQTLLLRAVVALRPGEFMGGVVVPLLHRVGQQWEDGHLNPYQEHAVSVAVRRVLNWLMELWEPAGDAPTLVAGTLQDEQHEFGALLAAAVAAEAGWRVVYLGPSLPADEIAAAARTAGARAVLVSAVYLVDMVAAEEGVANLAAELPAGVALLVGGRASPELGPAIEAVGATCTAHLEALQDALHRLTRDADA